MSAQFFSKLKTMVKVTAGATLVYSAISLAKGDEQFYDNIVMPTMRKLPAEISHRVAVFACKYNLLPVIEDEDPPNLSMDFFGKRLSNPIGIAAGFDKNGEAIEGLLNLGFGFVEVGSVTPRPQPGNPLPRVFRLNNDEAIINRYGFNNDGHERVYKRVSYLRENEDFNGIVGVNLGKNKTTKKARLDYVKGVETFGPVADYLVINVSSPNTPGLRSLQSKDNLKRLLKSVVDTRDSLLVNNTVPLFLKLSPDLNKEDLHDIVNVVMAKDSKIDGLIVTNTTVTRENLQTPNEIASEEGGLSGPPLRAKSTQFVADLYSMTGGKIPIIGVGGVSSGKDAFEKIEAGASYVQFYTALVYQGPMVVNRIKKELSEILNEKGFKNVSQAVGSNYKKYTSKEVAKTKKYFGLF